MKKVKKENWFITGMDILEKEGFGKITIENLCNSLNITKGSFYHHFRNIDGYINQLMEYWLQKNTLSLIDEVDGLATFFRTK